MVINTDVGTRRANMTAANERFTANAATLTSSHGSRTSTNKSRGKKHGATARSFAILEYVAAAHAPVDVLDIIASLSLPKATAYRLVDWFICRGYLAREPGRKRLIVGPKMINLAFGTLTSSMHNDEPHVVLQRLVRTLDETCNIGTLLNGEVVYLDRVEAEHWPLRLHYTSGSRVPLHCSAIGKLFLALVPAARRQRLLQSLELTRFTDHTITDRAKLEVELQQIRKEKVAFDRQEYLIGVICMAIPVTNASGEIIAALAIQAPGARMTLQRAHEHLPVLCQAGEEISKIFQAKV